MPPTPFSNTDDSESATISGSDGDGVFKNATNGSTTVGGVTPLTTNTGGGIVRIDTSSAEVGINANPARALHVNSSSQNECARFESTDTEVAVEFKDTTGTATLKCRNDYRFDNGSGELVRITAAGLVGINEVNPGSKLQVTTAAGGGDGYLKIKDGTHGGDVRFGMEAGVNNDALLGTFTANGLSMYTNSTARFTMSDVGNAVFKNHTDQSPTHVFIGESGNSGTGYTHSDVVFTTSHSDRGAGCYYFNTADDATFFAGPMYDDSESWGINWKSGTTLDESAADRQYSIFNINRQGRLKVGGGHTDILASHTPELVVGNGSGNAAMSLFAGSSSYAYIFFSHATSGAGADTGHIRYNFSDDTVYTNRVWSGPGFTSTSDQSLKTNIVDLQAGLGVVMQLRPIQFDWRDETMPNGVAGFIAQDVEKVLPNAAAGSEGEKSISFNDIVAHLTKAVQELSARVESLEAQLRASA